MANEYIQPGENIRVTPQGSHLEIVWKWSEPNFVVLAIAAGVLGWIIFENLSASGLSLPDLLRLDASKLMQDPIPQSAFALLMPLVVCAILYLVIARFVNRTRISVSSERIVIRHGPLPWRGNKTVAAKGIKKVFIRYDPSRNRRNSPSLVNLFFDVLAIADNGDTVELLSGLGLSEAQATCIAGSIAERLGLRTAKPVKPAQPVQPAVSAGARPGSSGAPAATRMLRETNSGVARLMLSFLGIIAIAGGVTLIVPVVELHRSGANYMSQVIRGLFGAWPLVVGILFLGGAMRLLSDRVVMFLYGAAFMIPAIAFPLLAYFGKDGGSGAVYVTRQNIEAEKAKRALAGQQVTQVAAGRVFKDCDDCPDMVEIPPGSFVMGSERRQESTPAHKVTFANPFALARTEITQGQWRAVMGGNPSYFASCGDNCPVEKVSWSDAQKFVRKLSEKTGQAYRLPSEAEWEYACRAGGSFAFCGSDDPDSIALNRAGHHGKTYPVARKQANAFGLYDMSGNVWEWTEDCWHDNYTGAPGDGSAWIAGGSCSWSRVVRGGSWYSDPRPAAERGIAVGHWDVRGGGRPRFPPEVVGFTFGLRPARVLP
jgi:formylglycine-generating enzyme required for sulfatase activity